MIPRVAAATGSRISWFHMVKPYLNSSHHRRPFMKAGAKCSCQLVALVGSRSNHPTVLLACVQRTRLQNVIHYSRSTHKPRFCLKLPMIYIWFFSSMFDSAYGPKPALSRLEAKIDRRAFPSNKLHLKHQAGQTPSTQPRFRLTPCKGSNIARVKHWSVCASMSKPDMSTLHDSEWTSGLLSATA